MTSLKLLSLILENTITPPEIPNTMNFWHGGNLDKAIKQKKGRMEFGVGLYLTHHYDTARKYSKGNRRLYLITVEKGVDINNAFIPADKAKEFVQNYIIGHMRKMIWETMQQYIKNDQIKGYLFNNIINNHKAIKPSNTKHLKDFYIRNGIDYEVIDNAFGWGEKMMILYNMKKIINTIVVKSTDRFTTYDLK